MIDSRIFDEKVDRRGSMSYKWDTTEPDILPMWVADMDFRTAPCIIEALAKRVAHGVFGYTAVPDEYYDATCRWFKNRHGWEIDKSKIIYTSGVVPAISATIKALTRPGDEIVTLTPAYNCFFSSIRNNGCNLVPCDLVCDEKGYYSIDFASLEAALSRPSVKLFILCNPHNPSGRVWTKDELLEIGRLCMKHGIVVLSDEIHCELTYPGHEYTPYASIDKTLAENCVVFLSPSKAFNIAGLQIANIVCGTNEELVRIDRAINDNEVCDVNPFGVTATIAAYNEGGEWLDALKSYLWGNFCLLRDYFHEHLPEYAVTPLEGTYLGWINVSASRLSGDEITELLLREASVRLNTGSMYGSGGENFVRINLACPRSVLEGVLPKICLSLRSVLPNA